MEQKEHGFTKDDVELAEEVMRYVHDPLGFVLSAYPWGEGELAGQSGPDEWQRQLLVDIGKATEARQFDGIHAVEPIRMAVASGHGIGKSVMVAWIANWIMSTRPDSQGTITANTYIQLKTKTWAAIQKWTKLCATAHWFEVGQEGLFFNGRREQWFLNCQTCSEENSEAFAGQHAATSTSYYIIDEASAVPDIIDEVSDGGLRDGEPMKFAFGNPTRNTGWFHAAVFGDRRHRWDYRSIDSRKCRFPNPLEIQKDIDDYGIDSDRVRVRVLGLPPAQSEDQLIGSDLVEMAQSAVVAPLDDEPLVCGVDVPDGGSAWFVVRFRRGMDARGVPAPIRVPGVKIDRQQMIAKLASILGDGVKCDWSHERVRPAAMFIDSAFGSPIAERLLSMGHNQVQEINFGGKSPDDHFANMRAYMWAGKMKEFLKKGSIDPNDKKLAYDLTAPGFHFNRSNAIVVESKQDMAHRGIASPDDGDALALTFARPVAMPEPKRARSRYNDSDYSQFG